MLDFSPEELKILVGLASDQVFRREFIDPKMPGYRVDPEELKISKALVNRLNMVIQEMSGRVVNAKR